MGHTDNRQAMSWDRKQIWCDGQVNSRGSCYAMRKKMVWLPPHPVELLDGMLGWLVGFYVAAYQPSSGAKTIPASFKQSTSSVTSSWLIPSTDNKEPSKNACVIGKITKPWQIEI
jgi:hypothetical protein